MKRIVFLMLSLGMAVTLHAQWTAKDSVNLQRILNGKEDIKLNMDAVKQIDFNSSPTVPKMSKERPGLRLDETLPQVLEKKKVVLTLRPYTANTKYNWDPIYQKKIKVDKDTWRGDEFYALKILMIPTNWAKHPFDAGPRETVEQIEATGLRYRVTERANNMAVGGWQGASGGGISGLDLMVPFTREFWNFKGRKRRARTLEVLKAYGDSTTVLIKQPVKLISE